MPTGGKSSTQTACAASSGGVNITVTGDNLMSVAKPIMTITTVYEQDDDDTEVHQYVGPPSSVLDPPPLTPTKSMTMISDSVLNPRTQRAAEVSVVGSFQRSCCLNCMV